MKRIVQTIVALAGVSGFIWLLNFRPPNTAIGAVITPSPDATDTATPLPAETPTPTPATPGPATPVPMRTPAPTPAGRYRSGTYTGAAVANGYGTVQVQAVVSGGRLTDIRFLQMPSEHRESVRIATMAEPALEQEAISAQSAYVDKVTGATADSQAFVQSLQAALNQAS
jgi:uncharacterized protein with FMN-binding domain